MKLTSLARIGAVAAIFALSLTFVPFPASAQVENRPQLSGTPAPTDFLSLTRGNQPFAIQAQNLFIPSLLNCPNAAACTTALGRALVLDTGLTVTTGPTTLGGVLDQTVTGNIGGHCSMVAGTSCTASIVALPTTFICIAEPQSATPIAGSCTATGTTVTVHAGSSNSVAWGYVLIGDPN